MKLKNSEFIKEISRNKILYLMFLPVAIYFIIFAYIPMTGIVVAFKEFNFEGGLYFSPWNGIDNFKYFFTSGKAWLVTRNTVLYNLSFMLCYNVFSITIAIMLAEIGSSMFRKITQSFIFLPYFISWVTVAAFMYNIFGYEYGALNNLLASVNVSPVDIYGIPQLWFIILPILYVWKWIGFGSILYLSAILGIDQACYEAATIDGTNIFQRIRYITLPMLKPTTIILLLLGIGRIMRGEFSMFYQLVGLNGTLFPYTDIIDTLVFRSLLGQFNFSMASAAGLYQSVLCFIIITTVNSIVRKANADYALF